MAIANCQSISDQLHRSRHWPPWSPVIHGFTWHHPCVNPREVVPCCTFETLFRCWISCHSTINCMNNDIKKITRSQSQQRGLKFQALRIPTPITTDVSIMAIIVISWSAFRLISDVSEYRYEGDEPRCGCYYSDLTLASSTVIAIKRVGQ